MPGSEYPVDEKLLALDENSHSFEYQVLEGDVNIMQDYRVAASLEAIDGGTRARWNCSFSGVSVEGVEPESMIGIMQEMYGGMLEAIAAEANRR